MDWCFKDEDFKVRLFRFIDALPSLRTDEQIVHLAREYFGEEVVLPTVLLWGLQAMAATGLGACVSKHCARCVFGKAMTSRIDSAPAIMATIRSRPKAMPPWGGAPYCSASSR